MLPKKAFYNNEKNCKLIEQIGLNRTISVSYTHLVKKTPLPTGGESKKMGVQTGAEISNRSNEMAVPLEFLPEEERQVVLNVAAQILLTQENERMRPEIVAHRKKIAEWNKRKRQQEREFGAGWNRGRNQEPRCV